MFDPQASDLMDQLDDLPRVAAFLRATNETERQEFVRRIPDLRTRCEIDHRLWRAASRAGRPPMSQAELLSRVARLVTRYPQVQDVILVGTRGVGTARPDTDWEILIVLEDTAYEEVIRVRLGEARRVFVQRDQIEQRVAFDPQLREGSLLVFFWRPDAEIGYWGFGPDEPIPTTSQFRTTDAAGRVELREFDPTRADRWHPDHELFEYHVYGVLEDPTSVWRERRGGRSLYCRHGYSTRRSDYRS